MLTDDITITISSGAGGNGRVAFNKTKMTLGPTGGTGGRGGDVVLCGVANIGALAHFKKGKKVFHAENGQMGGAQKRSGRDGEMLMLNVPVGTVVHILTRSEREEITKIGQTILLANGGRGGRGNFSFRSSRNTTPRQSEKGKKGTELAVRLELKLIADVGLIGLPNVGKSSLLNMLTNANSRVANYPFTTLEPHLGAFYELILADIPGLIEGASGGKGLGLKFLRHIERTGVFFHLVSAQSDDPLHDYAVVRKELEAHNPQLLKKSEYVFLSKCDLVTPSEKEQKMRELKKVSPRVIGISTDDEESIARVKKILTAIIKEKMVA